MIYKHVAPTALRLTALGLFPNMLLLTELASLEVGLSVNMSQSDGAWSLAIVVYARRLQRIGV